VKPKNTKILDNVVYILGAGFSAPLGLPVISNFLDKSKDMYASDADSYPHFSKVFSVIEKMHKSGIYYNADLFNVEEILSILEMREAVDDETERSSFIKYIIDVIDHYTPMFGSVGKKNLNAWRDYAFGSVNSSLYLYGYFVGNLLKASLSQNSSGDLFCNPISESNYCAKYSVITLNYDLVLENCYSYLSETFGADQKMNFSCKVEDNVADYQSRTHLAKLHGSVDTGVIVPPTWNKGLQNQIKPAWQLAYKLLTDANQIRIIGYSLPLADSYIRYLLKASIIKCENLKKIDVICLDDANQSIKKRYDEFIRFPKYTFKSGNIIEYLKINYAECVNNNSNASLLRMNSLEAAHDMFFNKA